MEGFPTAKPEACRPSTVQTLLRWLKGFFEWLLAEGDFDSSPMVGVPTPIVLPIEILVLTATDDRQLLETCIGKGAENRRDTALLTNMPETDLRLIEVTNPKLEDVGEGRMLGMKDGPHTLSLTYVANWLRKTGSEVNSSRLADWTSSEMARRYAQHRATERTAVAHRVFVSPGWR